MDPERSTAAREYMGEPMPAASTPWREADYAVVDLELTGLDPRRHEIISLAVVRITEGRVRVADTLYRIVRPARMPDGETIRIHGLRESDLAGAPPLADVMDELLAALTGKALVAHVAPIEEGFLRPALGRHGLELRNPVLDTARLAAELGRHGRRISTGGASGSSRFAVSSPGLSDLARSLGLPVHRPHHADGDALTAAQVFIALATHFEALEEGLSLGSLQRLSRRGGEGLAGGSLRRLFERVRN